MITVDTLPDPGWHDAAQRVILAVGDNPEDDRVRDLVLSSLDDEVLPDSELAGFCAWICNEHAHALHLGRPEYLHLDIAKRRNERRAEARESARADATIALSNKLRSLNPLQPPADFARNAEALISDYRRSVFRGNHSLTPVTAVEFIDHVNRARNDDCLRFSLFPDQSFRRGTQGIIGARTGRGKTATLVTIAVDAIEQGLSVIIETLEDTPVQMIERLVLNLFRRMFFKTEIHFEWFSSSEWPRSTMTGGSYPDSRQCLYAALRDESLQAQHAEELRQAWDAIASAIRKERLRIIDARGARLEQIVHAMRDYQSDVTLVDYLQRLPAPEELVTQTRQVQVQATSSTLVAAAAEINTVMVCAAQFNRINSKTASKGPKYDRFDDESFREAGDIEQDAYLALGIGWEEGKRSTERFYKVLKAREADPGDGEHRLLFEGAFSLMWPTGEPWRAPQEQRNEGRGKRYDL